MRQEFGGSLGEDQSKVITGQGEPAPIGKGPDGPAARVSLFGSQNAAGHSFVFAIDRSQSMGGKGLNALKAAEDQLHLVLADLKENHSFKSCRTTFAQNTSSLEAWLKQFRKT